MLDLTGKMVVTGGGRGIGRAMARADADLPDDVGPLCVYFAADESAWTTGSVVQVTGGSPLPVGFLTYLHHKNKNLT